MREKDEWVNEQIMPRWDEFLVEADHRLLMQGDQDDKDTVLSYAKTALILEKWTHEIHQETLEKGYDVAPGDLHAKKENALWLLHGMSQLARTERPDWVKALDDLQLCIEHGAKKELLPLLQLKRVGRVRARALFNEGFRHPADLKQVPLSRLANLPKFGPKLAADILAQVGGDPEQEPPQPEATPPSKGKGQATIGDFGA
jgi:helicase